MAASGLSATERQRLEALLDKERATRLQIDDLEKQTNRSSRQQLELESQQRQEKDLARLQLEFASASTPSNRPRMRRRRREPAALP